MPPDDFSRSLGQRLRQRRQVKNLKQDAVAREAGVAPSTLCELESGKAANPGIVTVMRVAGVLGVKLGQLVRE